MNMKKIVAGVAASALAVTTLAVSAFAGPVTSSLAHAADDGNGNFQVFIMESGELYYDIDVTKIASVDVTISFDALEGEWVGGAIITQCDAKSWNDCGQYANGDEGKAWNNVKSGDTLTVELGEGTFAADSTYVIVTVQNYASTGVAVNIDNVVLKDASGNVLLDVAGGASAPADSTPEATTEAAADPAPEADNAPSDSAPASDPAPEADNAPAAEAPTGNTAAPATADKSNADTGVEGVAVIAGIAIVAAGAIVIAKKRK